MVGYSLTEKEEYELYKKVTGRKIPFYEKTQSTSPDSIEHAILYFLDKILQHSTKVSPTLEERVEYLEREIRRLKEKLQEKHSKKLTKADLIYEKYKEELEKKYFGKIVAIDVDSGTIVGIGDSILEAYEEARKKSKKRKFSYKKVGYPFVCKLR
jgi:hypothetical protein